MNLELNEMKESIKIQTDEKLFEKDLSDKMIE